MHSANLRHQFHIHRTKIVVLFLLFLAIGQAQAQSGDALNLPEYDTRLLQYGFSIGTHLTKYRIRYGGDFQPNNPQDSLYSVQPPASPGFSLGLIVNMRLLEYLDVRFVPRVSFNEYRMEYYYDDGEVLEQLLDKTFVEFPFLLKYKSHRYKNHRMYVVGGFSPAIEARGRNDQDNNPENLLMKSFNLSAEVGFGFDLYYPLFKFSPEIRFSMGLLDMLKIPKQGENKFTAPIERMTANSISIFIQFQ